MSAILSMQSAEYGANKGGWSCEDPQNTPGM